MKYTDPFKVIITRLEKLESLIIEDASKYSEPSKRVLDLEEACSYLNFKQSYMRKLMRTNKIPYYRPNDGKAFFDVEELTKWALQNRRGTESEANATAALTTINLNHA